MRRALRVPVSRHSPGTAASGKRQLQERETNEFSLARNKGHLPCLVFGSGQSQTQDGYISRAIKDPWHCLQPQKHLCPSWNTLSVSKTQ